MTTPTKTPAFRITGLLSTTILLISGVMAGNHHTGPSCVFRRAFHIPCPGCGLTRSFDAIWRGDLPASFHYHPLGLPLFALLVLCAGTWILSSRSSFAQHLSAQWERLLVQPRVWLVGLALWLGVWLVRLAWAKWINSGYWW